ncbi:putative protein kinase protein [Rhizobium phage RHph_I1_18]|nr:putative protein kinase protein [Rhizobium phage RHph_I1_18]
MKSFSEHIAESLRKPTGVDILRQQTNHLALTSGHLNRINMNFEPLGSGAGGSVFMAPNNQYVIKVFDQEDTGYKRWLAFSLQNQNNSFVPKIKGKPTPINNRLAFVRLEFLQPVKGHKDMFLTDWWSNYRRQIRRLPGAWKPDQSENRRQKKNWPLEGQNVDEFIKAMAFIDNHSFTDFRRDNIMQRANGEVVIVDPLYTTHEKKLSRYSKEIENFLRSRF